MSRLHCLFCFQMLLLGCTPTGERDKHDTEQETFEQSQALTFSSNLPLVIIDTQGQGIPTADKVKARMQIIPTNQKGVSYLNSSKEDTVPPLYDGWIGIERRGASSGSFPKKQFSLETRTASGADTDIGPFGLPPEEDWILHAPYSDKSLMRNHLAYWMSNEIGRWATHTVYVEAFINQEENPFIEDQYWGIYLFMEKIKRDDNRVNIVKIGANDDEEPAVTGGYIFNYDRKRSSPDDCVYYPPELSTDQCLRIIAPKVEDLTEAQRAWIVGYFEQFENTLSSDAFADPENGYAELIDVDSFVDYLILHELFKNIDGLRHSAYLHKDRNGRLKAGPYWDCNLCMGNADYFQGMETTGWCLDIVSRRMTKSIPFWWKRLLADPAFVDKLIERWRDIRRNILTDDHILAQIDDTAALLGEAQKRNFDRWPSMGVKIRFNPEPLAWTYEEEVEKLKQWLRERLTWMDENIETVADLGAL